MSVFFHFCRGREHFGTSAVWPSTLSMMRPRPLKVTWLSWGMARTKPQDSRAVTARTRWPMCTAPRSQPVTGSFCCSELIQWLLMRRLSLLRMGLNKPMKWRLMRSLGLRSEPVFLESAQILSTQFSMGRLRKPLGPLRPLGRRSGRSMLARLFVFFSGSLMASSIQWRWTSSPISTTTPIACPDPQIYYRIEMCYKQ